MVVTTTPLSPAMKRTEEGRFDLAWGGIASLSISAIIWTECQARGFTLDDLVRWMSSAPAVSRDSAIRREPSPQAATPIRRLRSRSILVVKPEVLHYRTPSRLISKNAHWRWSGPPTFAANLSFKRASFPIRHKAANSRYPEAIP